MSLQRLHTLEIPRRPHYASRLLPAPTLHRPIEPSAHQKLPGFIEPQIRNHISVRRHRINRLLPPQIPHLDRVVVAPRRQLPFTAVLGPTWNPFGANRQQSMPFACPCASASARFSLSYLQNQRAAPRSQVPQPAHARLVAGRREAPVALEGQAHDVARVAVLEEELVPRFHVPEAEGGVERNGADEAAWG